MRGVKMKKKPVAWIACLLAIPLLVLGSALYGASNQENDIPKNELPMYGGMPFTPAEESANKLFLAMTLATSGGSKEKAYQSMLESAWHWYFQKNYSTAMKRFNQAWLINPNDPRVFSGYGAIADARGNRQEAIAWYRKGAEMGDPHAQYNLADEYFFGRTLKTNYVEAAKWYRKAADQNVNLALNMIGVCYQYGLGVPRSTAEAQQWYKKADEKGGIPPKRLKMRQPTPEDQLHIPPEGEMFKE